MLYSKTFGVSNMGEAAIKSHYKIKQSELEELLKIKAKLADLKIKLD